MLRARATSCSAATRCDITPPLPLYRFTGLRTLGKGLTGRADEAKTPCGTRFVVKGALVAESMPPIARDCAVLRYAGSAVLETSPTLSCVRHRHGTQHLPRTTHATDTCNSRHWQGMRRSTAKVRLPLVHWVLSSSVTFVSAVFRAGCVPKYYALDKGWCYSEMLSRSTKVSRFLRNVLGNTTDAYAPLVASRPAQLSVVKQVCSLVGWLQTCCFTLQLILLQIRFL